MLRELEKAGLVVRKPRPGGRSKDKTEQIASLAVDPAEALARMEPRRKTAPMGYEVTSLLCNLGSASVKELCYFTGASHQTVKSLEKREFSACRSGRCSATSCRISSKRSPCLL
ncbi:MAG: hypothetical protein ACLR1T_03465 [Evtepia gabavorous]